MTAPTNTKATASVVIVTTGPAPDSARRLKRLAELLLAKTPGAKDNPPGATGGSKENEYDVRADDRDKTRI